MSALGVDGCRGGWIGVAWPRADVLLDASLARLVERAGSPVGAIAIDMPIGLLDDGASGDRPCDKAARRALGPRRASVFPPPTRRQLLSPARPAGVTLQAWNLRDKILEVDALVAARPDLPLVESHPELCFAALAGGAPVAEPKRVAAGRARRVALLRAIGGDPFARILDAPLRAMRGDGGVVARPDDLLDACALAWAARRRAEGAAPLLREGQRPGMEIWAPRA